MALLKAAEFILVTKLSDGAPAEDTGFEKNPLSLPKKYGFFMHLKNIWEYFEKTK